MTDDDTMRSRNSPQNGPLWPLKRLWHSYTDEYDTVGGWAIRVVDSAMRPLLLLSGTWLMWYTAMPQTMLSYGGQSIAVAVVISLIYGVYNARTRYEL